MNDSREKLWHREARLLTEFYLRGQKEIIFAKNYVSYSDKFIQENDPKRKRFPGHSYDIWTNKRIVEIDDLDQHLHKSQMINDGIARKYAIENLQMPFYRLLKEEICNRRGQILIDCFDYLERELKL